jgi:hypothetical protein
MGKTWHFIILYAKQTKTNYLDTASKKNQSKYSLARAKKT